MIHNSIKHIVVLMMSSRSFDHMLGFMKSENASIRGVRENDYFNVSQDGRVIPVSGGAAYQGQLPVDPGHSASDVEVQMYGNRRATPSPSPDMSGFVKSYEILGGDGVNVMRCFRPEQLPSLSALAREYAVCDQWFSSVPGPSIPNLAFAHYGTSFGQIDMSPHRFRARRTIYQRLGDYGITSRLYHYSTWSGTKGLSFFLADHRNYFGLWGDFRNDCQRGILPAYSFVEPAYADHGLVLATDQAPDHSVATGDHFIGEVYETIRQNDAVWQSTVLLIVWDQHGGIFDHEIPPIAPEEPFGAAENRQVFERFGVRVPAVVVSPFVEPGTVDHTVYDHASIPATVTAQFVGDPLVHCPHPRERQANLFLNVLRRARGRSDVVEFSSLSIPPNPAPQMPKQSLGRSLANRHQGSTAPHVFVSYCHTDLSIVRQIEKDLDPFVQIVRDERSVEYTDNLESYMRLIRTTDYALVVVSDAFLRSIACMFEIGEFLKDEDHGDRILPVLLADYIERGEVHRGAHIYDTKDMIDYVAYWENEEKTLRAKLQQVDLSNLAAFASQLSQIQSITKTVSEFILLLRRIRHETFDNLQATKYEALLGKLGYGGDTPIKVQ